MIDPDLIEAREIVKATLTPENHRNCICRGNIDAGYWNDGHKVRATLAGIKRGKALARACTCAVCQSDMIGLVPCLNEGSS